jgi:hypothetical protein
VDIDILKPNTGYISIERPSPQVLSPKTSSGRQTSSGVLTPEDEPQGVYVEPVSEGEEDEDMAIAPAKDESLRTGLTGEAVAEAVAFREKKLQEQKASEAAHTAQQESKKNGKAVSEEPNGTEAMDERMPLVRQLSPTAATEKPRALSIDPLAPSSAFDKTFRERLRAAHQDQERERGFAIGDATKNTSQCDVIDDLEGGSSTALPPPDHDRELVRNWVAPAGKRIAVPVRIEPKVYFAVERTFLVCCSFT